MIKIRELINALEILDSEDKGIYWVNENLINIGTTTLEGKLERGSDLILFDWHTNSIVIERGEPCIGTSTLYT